MRHARSAILFLLLAALFACGGEEYPTPVEVEEQESPSSDPPRPLAQLLSDAQGAYDRQDYERAQHCFEQALETEPGDPQALFGCAWAILMAEQGAFEEGRPPRAARLELATARFDELSEAGPGVVAWKVRLGRGMLSLLEFELLPSGSDEASACLAGARARFEQVLAEPDDPGARDNLTALTGLARIAELEGEWESALSYRRRAIGQIGRSLALWERALGQFPNDARLWGEKMVGALEKEIEHREAALRILGELNRPQEEREEREQIESARQRVTELQEDK